MKPMKKPPIFCDHCPSLALAELDSAPLCEACLLSEVKKSPNFSLALKIEPLFIDTHGSTRKYPSDPVSTEAA